MLQLLNIEIRVTVKNVYAYILRLERQVLMRMLLLINIEIIRVQVEINMSDLIRIIFQLAINVERDFADTVMCINFI